MRKIIMGIIWIVVLWFAFNILGGCLGGFMAGFGGLEKQESTALLERCIPIINLVSIILAIILGVIGTARGILPFTRR